MKSTGTRTAAFWVFPLAALLFAAWEAGGIQPWFYYAIGALALSGLSALVGPRIVGGLAKSMGLRRALILTSLVGWAVIGGALLVINGATAHMITWSVYPAAGLALWPLAVWWLSAPKAEGR